MHNADPSSLLAVIEQQTKEIEELKRKYTVDIRYLKDVIDNFPGSIYWKNREGVYLGHNRFAREKMRSVNLSEDVIGRTDYDLFKKEVADKFRQHDLEVMNEDTTLSVEETTVLSDGQKVIQLSTKKPLHDETGKVIGVVGNTVDITHLKEIEASLKEAKENAEVASKAKTEFIRNLEHDIRTPLSGMYLLTSFLAKKETEPEKQKILQSMERCTKELMNYCNGVIDLVYAQSGTNLIVEEKINLLEIIERVIALEKPPAVHKNLQLTVDYPDYAPTDFISDSYRLERILINLTSNAIKFTHEGHVKISVRILHKEDAIDKAMVAISIADTGIGVPADMQERIFERFFRLTPSDQSVYKGTGLGLSVVKTMVEELKGQIKLESYPEQGSVFTCSFSMRLASIELE